MIKDEKTSKFWVECSPNSSLFTDSFCKRFQACRYRIKGVGIQTTLSAVVPLQYFGSPIGQGIGGELLFIDKTIYTVGSQTNPLATIVIGILAVAGN